MIVRSFKFLQKSFDFLTTINAPKSFGSGVCVLNTQKQSSEAIKIFAEI